MHYEYSSDAHVPRVRARSLVAAEPSARVAGLTATTFIAWLLPSRTLFEVGSREGRRPQGRTATTDPRVPKSTCSKPVRRRR